MGGFRPVALVKEFAVIFFARAVASGVSSGPKSRAPTETGLFAIDSIVAETILIYERTALIKVPFLKLHPNAQIPTQANEFDAGFDLSAVESVHLAPFERAAIGTGIAIALEKNQVGLVHPRSGLAIKHGIGVLNAPGTIDAGYRGEIKVILINLNSQDSFEIKVGDRIAQLIIQEVASVEFELVEQLPQSARGTGGFGSSGR